MFERRHKLTVEQLETLYPFDPAIMAERAGMKVETFYYAMCGRPILKPEAERIMVVLSEHTGLKLGWEQMEIVTWDEFLILWIVRASAQAQPQPESEVADAYHFVYARDLAHAREVAQRWLDRHPHLPYHYFTPYPDGFRVADAIVPGRWQLDIEV